MKDVAPVSLDSFKCRKTLSSRRQDVHLLFAARGREERPRRHLQAALLDEGAAREPAAPRGRPHRHQGRHRERRRLADRPRQGRQGDRLPPRPRADAGFHRRSRRRRPRRHARRHEAARRRPAEDQPAGARRSRHRPLGDRRRLRLAAGLRQQRRARIPAQRRALQLPQVGPGRLRQLPRRAARHRHLPPGQPRVPVADGVDAHLRRRHHPRLSRHARRHRQPHHHGQRPRRARLGRRRHRGRGRHARPGRSRCCCPRSSASSSPAS